MCIKRTAYPVKLLLNAARTDGSFIYDEKRFVATAVVETATGDKVDTDEANLCLQILMPKQRAEEMAAGMRSGVAQLSIEGVPTLMELSS